MYMKKKVRKNTEDEEESVLREHELIASDAAYFDYLTELKMEELAFRDEYDCFTDYEYACNDFNVMFNIF